MLKRMKITNPTQQQKEDTEKKAIEEHDVQKLLQKHVTYYPNGSIGKYNNGKSDSNHVIAFATVTEEKETNKNDKKDVTCFKCKKKGHYSNECTEDLPATTKKGHKPADQQGGQL